METGAKDSSLSLPGSPFWPSGLDPEDLSCRGMRGKGGSRPPQSLDNREVHQCGKSHHLHVHKHESLHLHIGHRVAWAQGRPVPSGNIIWESVYLLCLLGCCLTAHDSLGTLI